MPASPTITVPARAHFNLHGLGAGTFTYPVADTGSIPITISGHAASITPLARAHPAQSWIVSITPRSLHLAPHSSGFLTIHYHVPAGVPTGSDAWVNIIAAARPLGHAGMAQEAAAVGGTLHLTHAGHKALTAAPIPPHGGPDVISVIILALAGAILALAAGGYFLRRQRGTRRAT